MEADVWPLRCVKVNFLETFAIVENQLFCRLKGSDETFLKQWIFYA